WTSRCPRARPRRGTRATRTATSCAWLTAILPTPTDSQPKGPIHMAYVLDYTVIAAGLPYQSSGTCHRDALNNFVFNPPLRFGYHRGDYHTQDGEQIIVVGPTQEA